MYQELPFHNELEKTLGKKLKKEVLIQDFRQAAGGCISNGGRLITTAGDFFLKYNSGKPDDFFKAEAKGLKLLQDAGCLKVPQVLLQAKAGEYVYLVMEWIAHERIAADYWGRLGEQLAAQHRHTADTFGLYHHNYIGSLRQYNTRHESWADFYRKERIERQLDLAESQGKMPKGFRALFDGLYKCLPDILPDEPASLLHGDLWSGNVIIGPAGQAVVIDPAVYYGSREMEIAFTGLFGGFDPRFYASYHSAYPLQAGFNDRVELYHIYPLLVHWNLFGESYRRRAETIVKRYV